MARGISIEIGENTFKTKKDALEFYAEILNSYNPGDILNSEDFELVFNLLKIHPNSQEKVGTGISQISVEKDEYSTQCFHVERIDGTKENFSYRKCINGEPNSFTTFSSACRKAIEEDLKAVKQEYFKNASSGKVKCQETGDLIEFEEAHVDHRQPNTFSVIVDRFIELNSLDLTKIEYNRQESYGHSFVDSNISLNFREYHKKKANLRVVKKGRNLARAYQGKINRQKKDLTIE